MCVCQADCNFVAGAGDLEQLRDAEMSKGIQPDPEINAFMKANTLEGKRESIHTDFVMHSLGLGVCADTMVCSHEKIILCVKLALRAGGSSMTRYT